MLVVISGVPGVGKSAVAAELASRWSGVHLSIDPVEDALLTAGSPEGRQTGVAAYEATRACAELNLAQGRLVVVDAVNDSEAARSTWRTAAARADVPLVLVLLTCGDEVEHRRRLERRTRGFSRLAEPTWPQVLERLAQYEPWAAGECIVVDTVPVLPLVVEEVERQIGERDTRSSGALRGLPDLDVRQDGAAVAAARCALTSHWRSTVVPGEGGGWVVRTWTSTPPGDSWPSGTPDAVHRVEVDDARGKLVTRQVHPPVQP